MKNQHVKDISAKKLEWGNHNPKLTHQNFIDGRHKKISDQNELLAPSNAPINLSKKKGSSRNSTLKKG